MAFCGFGEGSTRAEMKMDWGKFWADIEGEFSAVRKAEGVEPPAYNNVLERCEPDGRILAGVV